MSFVGRYHIIKPKDISLEQQRAVLRLTTRAHLHERLCALVEAGTVSASVVADRYHSLMSEAGVEQPTNREEEPHEEASS